MKVTLHWTDAMRRLTRHIADYIEDTESVPHGDMYWLETLMNFRRVESRATPLDRSVNNDKVAHMFDRSGLAGVLLGEEHFPSLERRRIYAIRLVDGFSGKGAPGVYPAELLMNIPAYPGNWKH